MNAQFVVQISGVLEDLLNSRSLLSDVGSSVDRICRWIKEQVATSMVRFRWDAVPVISVGRKIELV
jgi:hypothetical protein